MIYQPKTLKGNERIFVVSFHFELGRTVVCNLDHLEKVVSKSTGVSKICHLCDGNIKRMSKKTLKDMLIRHDLSTDFLKRI